jgi:hypothetical protein
MKNKIKIYFFAIFLISCNNFKSDKIYIKEGFLLKEGNYFAKNIKIVVKKLDDGSFIYAVCDRFNKNLYQSNIMKPLSQYHFWIMYLDKNENIWIYNSDYDSRKLLMKNNHTQLYSESDYCSINIPMPIKLQKRFKELKISNCK